jgi:type II secretory pathway pseudopilin PulG
MAAITFNAAHQKEQVRKQIEAALAAYREMLDTFVRDQMRPTAAEAEHARPRQTSGTRSPSKDAQ